MNEENGSRFGPWFFSRWSGGTTSARIRRLHVISEKS
jgi:hypothetical protein